MNLVAVNLESTRKWERKAKDSPKGSIESLELDETKAQKKFQVAVLESWEGRGKKINPCIVAASVRCFLASLMMGTGIPETLEDDMKRFRSKMDEFDKEIFKKKLHRRRVEKKEMELRLLLSEYKRARCPEADVYDIRAMSVLHLIALQIVDKKI